MKFQLFFRAVWSVFIAQYNTKTHTQGFRATLVLYMSLHVCLTGSNVYCLRYSFILKLLFISINWSSSSVPSSGYNIPKLHTILKKAKECCALKILLWRLSGWNAEEFVALCLEAASGMWLHRGRASSLSSSHCGIRLTMLGKRRGLWIERLTGQMVHRGLECWQNVTIVLKRWRPSLEYAGGLGVLCPNRKKMQFAHFPFIFLWATGLRSYHLHLLIRPWWDAGVSSMKGTDVPWGQIGWKPDDSWIGGR